MEESIQKVILRSSILFPRGLKPFLFSAFKYGLKPVPFNDPNAFALWVPLVSILRPGKARVSATELRGQKHTTLRVRSRTLPLVHAIPTTWLTKLTTYFQTR